MEPVVKELEATLTDWKNRKVWGAIEIEVQNGQVVLMRQETKKKFTSAGGFNNEPARYERR